MRYSLFVLMLMALAAVGCVQDDEKSAAQPPTASKNEKQTVPNPSDIRELTTAMNDMLERQGRLETKVKTQGAEIESLRTENRELRNENGRLKAEAVRAREESVVAKPPAGVPVSASGVYPAGGVTVAGYYAPPPCLVVYPPPCVRVGPLGFLRR